MRNSPHYVLEAKRMNGFVSRNKIAQKWSIASVGGPAIALMRERHF